MHLPFDVLLEIFSKCGEDDPNTIACVAGVCQQWRDIALGMPNLWSTLVLFLPPTVNHEMLRRLHQKAVAWLHNSQSEMVDITIDYGEHIDLQLHLLSYVTPASRRWSRITFRGMEDVCIETGPLSTRKPDGTLTVFSSIKDKSLAQIKEVSWTRPLKTRLSKIGIPHIELYIPPGSDLSKAAPLGKLSQFSSLQFQAPTLGSTWEEIVNAISLFPSLRHLWISSYAATIADPTHTTYKPVLLPSLRELHLVHFLARGVTIKGLLTRLILPQLKTLRIQSSGLPNGFHNYFVVKPALTFLSITQCPISEEEFKQVINIFGDLRALDIGVLKVTAAMLDAIGPDPNSVTSASPEPTAYPLPRLVTLMLSRNLGIASPALHSMAINRETASERKLARPIKHLNVWNCHPPVEAAEVLRLRAVYGDRIVA